MEKLVFDSGVKEYQIGDMGVLRFNPSDPNVYARFMNAMDTIQAVEEKLVAKAKALDQTAGPEETGTGVLKLVAEADAEIKGILSGIFGGGNDFDKILCGVNLMAVAGNGERVITNLLDALRPIMVSGAQRCAQNQADAAVAAAKQNRARRRARKHKRRR